MFELLPAGGFPSALGLYLQIEIMCSGERSRRASVIYFQKIWDLSGKKKNGSWERKKPDYLQRIWDGENGVAGRGLACHLQRPLERQRQCSGAGLQGTCPGWEMERKAGRGCLKRNCWASMKAICPLSISQMTKDLNCISLIVECCMIFF